MRIKSKRFTRYWLQVAAATSMTTASIAATDCGDDPRKPRRRHRDHRWGLHA